MLLSKHVYCVAVIFKMTEQVDQQISTKFCVKLEYSSTETIRMIQKATAMGNWCLAASSWQCACSCIMSCAVFVLVKHQITQVIHLHYNLDLAPCNFWLFLKLISPLKWNRFQTVDEILENTIGQLMSTRRNVWGPKVSTLKGTEVSFSYVQYFLYLISCSLNVSFS